MDVMGILEVRAGGLKAPTTGWAFKSDGAYFMVDVDERKQRGPYRVFPSLDALRAWFGEQAHFEPRQLDEVPQEVCGFVVEGALLTARTGQNVALHYFNAVTSAPASGGLHLGTGGGSHSCDE